MRFITLCALLALSVNSFAQPGREQSYKLCSDCILLKVSPNTIFDDKGGLVPLSLEYTFGEQFGIQLDLGVPILTELTWRDKTKKILQDFRVGGAMRAYFGFRDDRRGFVGLEVFYRQQKAHWGAGTFGANDTYTFSSADALQQSRVASCIVGFQRMLSRTLYFEGQAGLGVNYRSIEWTNIVDKKDGGYSYTWHPSDDKAIGAGFVPFIPLRISLTLLLGGTKRGYW